MIKAYDSKSKLNQPLGKKEAYLSVNLGTLQSNTSNAINAKKLKKKNSV